MAYQLIGVLIAFLLGLWAIIIAETAKKRVFIASGMAFLFFLPQVWRHPAAAFVSFVGWIVFGIGCYIFIRYKGVGRG